MSDAIKAETFQRYSVPHNTHMKMISSTLGSRVLGDCTSSLSFLPLQTPVIATTFFFSPSSCLSFPAGLDLLLMLTLVLSSGFGLLLFPKKLYKRCEDFYKPDIMFICVKNVRF